MKAEKEMLVFVHNSKIFKWMPSFKTIEFNEQDFERIITKENALLTWSPIDQTIKNKKWAALNILVQHTRNTDGSNKNIFI